MASAHDILKLATGEIGYTDAGDPETGSKYGRWYASVTNSPYFGSYGVPWCAMFVSYVLAQAGQSCAGFPSASCGTIRNAARNAGLIRGNKRNAQPGDAVFFDWNGNGQPDHIGFVEVNKGSYIQTIEGNTSPSNSGSQANGGGVYRRTRSWDYVLDVIAVPYTQTSSAPSSTGQDGDEMICIIQPNDDNCMVYFDGTKFHDITDPDCVTALDMVYQATHGGAHIPCIKLGNAAAPWASRLYQVIEAGTPSEAVAPSFNDMQPR